MAIKGKRLGATEKPAGIKQHMRTSIGRSTNSSPKNKDKRRSWKKYRGQGN